MRRIIESSFVSLDGVIGDPRAWAMQYFDDDSQQAALQRLLASDAMLMGRGTYEYFADDPPQTGEYADRINAIPKYVFSSTLESADWSNSTIVRGDVPAAVHLADELCGLATVVELGVAREVLRANLVLTQKNLRMSRVLARDHVDLLKDSQRAQRHVLEIPDRRRDEIELPYGLTVTLRRSPSRPQLAIRRGRTRKICGSYPRPKASPPEARISARPRISMPFLIVSL